MHGHNYHVSVKTIGRPGQGVGSDGYLIDFGEIKKAARDICKSLNEYFICPMKSDAVTITESETQLCLTCEDGAQFSFPKSDCAMLPLYHSSAEEISQYIFYRLVL